ncbi:MAG: hypothetical protein M1820_004921 [Bogoriella megaspora]|nr:MAG: hypothetical protein M1820_004921 [Bogoriella megaspora]
MGEELYVVTSSQDILAIYRETVALAFNPIIREIMTDFGLTDRTFNRMFDPQYSNKSWMDLLHGEFKLQMHPGEKLDVIQQTLLGNIDNLMRWEQSSALPVEVSSNANGKLVSLWTWCADVLIDSTTRAFFGDAIYEAAPNIIADFLEFDGEGWKLPYKYPYFAARRMYDSKAKLEKVFAKYLSLPPGRRQTASWIVQRIESGMNDIGISEESQTGPMLFVFYRLINTNAYRLCFWCLAYLLHNRVLLESIVAEIQPAFDGNGHLSMSYLLEKCPRLASFYEEILRMANDSMGARLVTKQTVIGNKVLQPGKKVLMPYKQLHFDPAVFGPNAADFDPERFLNHQSLSKSASWKPFGGGATYCPGRFLARREVYMFVALALNRFELSLEGLRDGCEPKLPRIDHSIPNGGVLPPAAGDVVLVRVKRKESHETGRGFSMT